MNTENGKNRNPNIKRQFIEINGKQTSYLQSGEGRPIIMLHAWPMCSDMYKPVMQHLSADCRCVAPDFPGFGNSEMTDEYLSYETLADFTAAFMDAHNFSSADLLGVSFGAGVGLVFAKKYPEKINKMVLNSPPIHFRPHLSVIQNKALLLSDKLPKLKETIFKGLTSGSSVVFKLLWGKSSSLKEEPFRSIFSQAKNMKLKAVDDTLHEIVNTDFRDILPGIKVPTLLLIGEEDKDFKPDFDLASQGISFACSQKVLEGGNHIMVATKAREFATVVNQFLAEENS
jgi:3-oxoadipate enol-lactonase